MSDFWKRLWCGHCWLEGEIVDAIYGKGYLRKWTCHKCGKCKLFTGIPLSYVSDHQPHGDLS